jgi:hypothetical protein
MIQLRIYLFLVFCTTCLRGTGQTKHLPFDSIHNFLKGKWSGTEIICKANDKDSTLLKLAFSGDSLSLTTIKKNNLIIVDKGAYAIEAKEKSTYSLTVLLTKKYPEYPYNALYIGLKIIDKNHLQITIVEAVYYNGKLNTRHYLGEFGILRDFSPNHTK